MDNKQGFRFTCSIDGKDLTDIPETSYGFSVRDSIHSFYSHLSFDLYDVGGIAQDNFLLCPGTKFNVKFGNVNEVKEFPSIIFSNGLQNKTSVQNLSGDMVYRGIHAFFLYDLPNSKGYQGSLSKIVKDKVASLYSFKNLVIDNSSCDGIWYQRNFKYSEFMNEIILPNSFSTEYDKDCPYFCYISYDNVFNYRNYKNFWTDNPVAEYSIYKTDLMQSYNDANNDNVKTSIYDYRNKKNVGINELDNNLETRYAYENQTAAEIINSDYSFETSGYCPSSDRKIAIKDLNQGITRIKYMGYDLSSDETYLEQAQQGKRNYDYKDSLFQETFTLTMPYNPDLKSGKLIKLNVQVKSPKDEDILSVTYTDNYLIETCTHNWIGKQSKAFTQVIVSRKFSKVKSDINIKDLLLAKK